MTVYLKTGMNKDTHPDRAHWITGWQTLLVAQRYYRGDYSPYFGPKTTAATSAFQKQQGLVVDGEVGPKTVTTAIACGWEPPEDWFRALVRDKVVVEPPAPTSDRGLDPSWPPPVDLDRNGESDLVYLSNEARDALWGPLAWKLVDGTPTLMNDWKDKNLMRVTVPQLRGLDCYGSKSSGMMTFHKKAAAQLLAAFQEIEESGLRDLVLSFGGTYLFRLIRGSTTTLSNHAYGVALDLNMNWNGLGKCPALAKERGTLRPLVPLFERYGFYWGGWYRSRRDGMHFECVQYIEDAVMTQRANEMEDGSAVLEALKLR